MMYQYIQVTLVTSYIFNIVHGSEDRNSKSNASLPYPDLELHRKFALHKAPKGDFAAKTRGFTVKQHHGRVTQKNVVHPPLVPHGLVESKHLRGGFSRASGESAYLRAGLRVTTNQHYAKQMPGVPKTVTNIAPPPSGLQSYCSSGSGVLGVGSYVEADWKGYGPYYKADVIKVYPDGSVDLKYRDGFLEERVPAKRIHRLPTEGPKTDPAKSDPACKLSNTVQGIQSQVEQTHEDIAIWLMEQRKKRKQADSSGIEGDVAEVKKQLKQKFGTNQDGALAAADTDGNGAVTKAELVALLKDQLGNDQGRAEQLAESVMKKLDTDNDGTITQVQYKDLVEKAAAPKAPSPSSKKGPMMANEVGKELNDYFGSPEKALEEADENNDSQVSEEELENVLEDMGHSPDRADELANITMSSLDPNRTGYISSNLFQDWASAKGLAAASGQGAKQQAKIEELEKENVDHEKELVKLKAELEELRKKMKEDAAAGNADPNSDEEKNTEIVRLKAAIEDHTNELGYLLGIEAPKADKEAAEDESLSQNALLDVIQKHGEGVIRRTDRLKKKLERLRAEGKVDPELEFQVMKILGTSVKMTGPLAMITNDANAEKSGDDDEIEDDLTKELSYLDDDMLRVRRDTAEMDTEVVPGNKKWWRYRWEYCYVEALLLILLATLAMIWEGIYNLLRAKINYLSTKSPFFKAAQHHNTLYFNWFVYMTGEFAVLLCVVFTLWVFDHLGMFELWISVQYDIAPEIHQPPNRGVYARQAYDIAMQLFFAMAMFYALTMCIVVSAVHKERNWRDFEMKNEIETARSVFSVVSIVNDDDEYMAMKLYFDETSQHGMAELQFWLYLSLNVRHNMTDIYNIKVLTWAVFLVIFVCFFCCHRFLHASYIHIFAILGLLDLLMFGGMIWMIHQEKVWLASTTTRRSSEEPKEHKPTIHEKYATERWVCIALQILLFFLCYGIARILCSPWTWLFYFWIALAMIVIFLGFVLMFRLYLAPTIITFMAIMSLPPYLDEGNKKMLKESCEHKHTSLDAGANE